MTKCLFCNREIENKNKEHAIPQWLLRNTGVINKPYNLGLNYNKFYSSEHEDISKILNESKYRYNLGNYTFPSCKDCNDKFSHLEADVSQIFSTMEYSNKIYSGDVNTLLDWFDKVRVAVWFGQISMNGKLFGINPKFGVEQRIGLHDRYLAIWKDDRYVFDLDGFDFYGTSNVHFFHNPIYIGMRYKNFILLNISHGALFSVASNALNLVRGISLKSHLSADAEFIINKLPLSADFSSLKFRENVPAEAVEVVQLLNHPYWNKETTCLYKRNNEFVRLDDDFLEIPNIDYSNMLLADEIKAHYKDEWKTRIHDIVKMETYLNFCKMHRDVFDQLKEMSSDKKFLDLIEMGQMDLDMYTLIMKKNLKLYIDKLVL